MPLAVIASGRARPYWLAMVVLPAFALRAFIPAGFMPAASGLEFCWGGVSTPMMATAGHAHGHHHDGPAAPSGSTSHGDGCVFAGSAAGFAPPSARPVVAAPPSATRQLELTASPLTSFSTIVRAQSPRGPPALS